MSKKKKNTNSKAKENAKTIFLSLFSNARAIDGARHFPWWVAVIMFVIAITLPVVPILVSKVNAYGTNFIAQYSYNFENDITLFNLDAYQQDVELEVTKEADEYVLKQTNWTTVYGEDVSTSAEDFQNNQYFYINTNSKQYDFLVFYTNKISSEFNAICKQIATWQYKVGSIDPYVKDVAAETDTPYTPSFIVFGKKQIAFYMYKTNSTTNAGYFIGDYKNLAEGTKLISSNVVANGITPDKDPMKTFTYMANTNYVKGVDKNWRNTLDTCYLTVKSSATLYTTLLMFGVYALLVVFMGLMVFLLTRGKRNMYNFYTFWDCEKISMWASVCPGLLSLVLGFILSSYAMMFFILLCGLRVMWLSMKQLRPAA